MLKEDIRKNDFNGKIVFILFLNEENTLIYQ